MSLTQERVREIFDYDPHTGSIKWRLPSSRRVHVGDEAGTVSLGYRRVNIDHHFYLAHPLAWLWMTGEWPKGEIDHVNLDRADNRWCNLRAATRSQNLANVMARINNSCGIKGVWWHKGAGKWTSQIQVDGTAIHLGLFGTKEAAHVAYAEAAKEHFGDFARAK